MAEAGRKIYVLGRNLPVYTSASAGSLFRGV